VHGMDHAWTGFVPMLAFIGFGAVILIGGWKARRARHDKEVGEDYLLLALSGLTLTAVFLALIFLAASKRIHLGVWMLLLIFLLGGALTYGSNRIVRGRKRQGN
jgi:hypothetical protein